MDSKYLESERGQRNSGWSGSVHTPIVISVSVAVNYRYRHYKSTWKLRLIIDMDFFISIYWVLGLKRYAQTTIRYVIWCTRYDMFSDCDPGLRSEATCTPPITTACAIIMCNGYNNGGLLRVSRCSVFVMNLLVLLEYTGCYLQYHQSGTKPNLVDKILATNFGNL